METGRAHSPSPVNLHYLSISPCSRVRTTIAVTEDGIFKILSRKRFGFLHVCVVTNDDIWCYLPTLQVPRNQARQWRGCKFAFCCHFEARCCPLHPFGVQVVKIYANFRKLRSLYSFSLVQHSTIRFTALCKHTILVHCVVQDSKH